ncbi:MAG: glycosyltransferase [Anaerolineae bacterium]|nr:glycosyltransferase [Anaerolineae bacterium]
MALRVTVLLTCYNHFAYLPDALASLDAQTFKDFDVIVLDDGSTDGSRELLREAAGSRQNWTLQFNEENLGTYGSLNKGLELANGDLIPVIDRVFALEQAAEAHRYMASNANVGKIILSVP